MILFDLGRSRMSRYHDSLKNIAVILMVHAVSRKKDQNVFSVIQLLSQYFSTL